MGSAAKPFVLSDCSKGSQGSSSTVQMARGECLEGDPKVGRVHQTVTCPLGPLGFEGAQHRQTLRPSVDGIRSKALRPFGLQ